MHLLELGHLFDLALIGVAAVAAAGAFLAAEVVVGFAAGVGAAGAEAPALDLVEVGIHLIHLHAPALGIELAVGHQLADGDIGGPLVAQRGQLFTAMAALAAIGCFAPQHRLEGDACFWEGVIGQEALIGEHRQQRPAFQFFLECGKGFLLAVDLVFVFLLLLGEGCIEGVVAVEFLPQLARLSREPFAFCHQLFEPFDQLLRVGSIEGCVAWIEESFRQQLLAGSCERLIEQPQKALQQLSLLRFHPAQPGVGEGFFGTVAFAGLLDGIQHRLQFSRQSLEIEVSGDPAIEGVGQQLTAQDGRCIEIATRRAHLALKHRFGI